MKNPTYQLLRKLELAAVFLALATPAVAQQAIVPSQESKPATASALTGQHLKVSGVITERNGDSLTLKLAPSKSIAVKVSSFTQVREKKSNPFRRGRKYQADQLMPGLAVQVEGRGDSDGALLADKILLTNDDLKTAQLIDARVSPVEDNEIRMSGQIQELNSVSNAARGGAKAAQETADSAHARIAALDDYESIRNITVRFKVGSADLSEDARKSLDDLALQAKDLKGFVIEVAGFASSEGNQAFNQRLSRQRAEAVSEYLAEQHDIPLRRIMTPTGYGVSHPVANNSTRTGRQENRRVEVRLMVNRGITTRANTGQAPISNKESASTQLNQSR